MSRMHPPFLIHLHCNIAASNQTDSGALLDLSTLMLFSQATNSQTTFPRPESSHAPLPSLRTTTSKETASLTIECKDGKASINFKCDLGHPDKQHFKSKKKRRKSANRISRNNARAAAFQARKDSRPAASQQSQQSAAISPAEDREVHDPLAGDQSGHLVSEQPSVLKTPTTPKRPVSSPTESLSKRPAVSLPDNPSPGPSTGPKVQLPVWDSTEHPYEILREESRDQDISITADLLSDTERHESDNEVKDSCEDEDDDENDKDEGEDEDEDGKEDDCRHWGCRLGGAIPGKH